MMSKPSTPSSELICYSCRQPEATLKNNYRCGLCQSLLCKNCAEFFDAEFFSFLKVIPDELKVATYCRNCFEAKVVPAKDSYAEIMRHAKEVHIFEKREKYIPLVKKERFKVVVEDCADRKETLLRLGFLAAEQDYNAVVDVEVTYKKIRNEGYQTTAWSGTGFLAEVKADRIHDEASK